MGVESIERERRDFISKMQRGKEVILVPKSWVQGMRRMKPGSRTMRKRANVESFEVCQ